MSKATTSSQHHNTQYSTTSNIPPPYDFASAVSFQSSFPPTTPSTSTHPTETSGSRKRKRSINATVETPNKAQRPVLPPSTPANRDSAVDMGNPVTSEDKKRNKLGYHRTSVACGHCRRRKIRCLIPEDEPSGRCSNCIKLKKDCHFFPVEQSIPVTERRPDSSRKALLPPRKSSGYSPLVKPHPGQVGDAFQFATPLQMGARSSFSLPPENTTAAGVFTSPKDVGNPSYNPNFETSSDWGHFSLQNSPDLSIASQSYSQPQAITHSHWNPPYQAVMPRSNSDFYPQHPNDSELSLQGPHRASFQSNPEVGWTGPVGRSMSFSAQGQAPGVPATAEEVIATQRRASTLPASYPYIDLAVEDAVSPTSKPFSATSGANPLGITAAFDPSSVSLSDLTRGLVQPTVGWGMIGGSAQPRTFTHPQSGNPSTSVEHSPFPGSVALPSTAAGFRPGEVNAQAEFTFTSADNGSIPALSYGEDWPGGY